MIQPSPLLPGLPLHLSASHLHPLTLCTWLDRVFTPTHSVSPLFFISILYFFILLLFPLSLRHNCFLLSGGLSSLQPESAIYLPSYLLIPSSSSSLFHLSSPFSNHLQFFTHSCYLSIPSCLHPKHHPATSSCLPLSSGLYFLLPHFYDLYFCPNLLFLLITFQ